MTLIAVTFNCSDDWNAHLKLFSYGFDNYKITKIVDSGIVCINNGLYQMTPYIPYPLKYPMREDEKYSVRIYLLNNPKTNIIGKAKLYLDDKYCYSVDIYRYY